LGDPGRGAGHRRGRRHAHPGGVAGPGLLGDRGALCPPVPVERRAVGGANDVGRRRDGAATTHSRRLTPMVAPRRGRLVLAATGDRLITQRLSCFAEPEFLRLREILAAADVRFTNMEMLFHNFEGYPQAESGGTWVCAE